MVGNTGGVLGAKVIEIKTNPDTEITVIEVMMSINKPYDFEKIEVIIKKSLQPIKLKSDVEWFKNYEDGVYGLRLELKKTPDFEFGLGLLIIKLSNKR